MKTLILFVSLFVSATVQAQGVYGDGTQSANLDSVKIHGTPVIDNTGAWVGSGGTGGGNNGIAITNASHTVVTFGGQTAINMAASPTPKWIAVGVAQSTPSSSVVLPTYRTGTNWTTLELVVVDNQTGLGASTNSYFYVGTNSVISPMAAVITGTAVGTPSFGHSATNGGTGLQLTSLVIPPFTLISIVMSNTCPSIPATSQAIAGSLTFRNGL